MKFSVQHIINGSNNQNFPSTRTKRILLSQLETIPYPNQSIQYDKYRFTALSVEFAKIREVRIIYQSAGASSSKTSNPKN